MRSSVAPDDGYLTRFDFHVIHCFGLQISIMWFSVAGIRNSYQGPQIAYEQQYLGFVVKHSAIVE